MFKKKVLAILAVLAMVLGLVACGNKTTTTAAVETTAVETTAAKEEEKKSVNLEILLERDDSMINTYSLLAVNDAAPFVDANDKAVTDVKLNTVGADALINWMLGEGADLAKNYGYDKYGEYLFYLLDNAPKSTVEIPAATEETKTIRMSTTTSVNDSGLLGYLLPQFESKYGYKVEVFSAGTGKSIANAKAGNADVILVHAKAQEEKFIEGGFARKVAGFDKERLYV
jgi:ABC-type tungstate transport system permease subunit